MLSFLRLLKQRYEQVLEFSKGLDHTHRQNFRRITRTLAFTEAYLEKAEIFARHPDMPTHIAVLGPTQSGKSSVINWLLQDEAAEMSPLAGYTVHPQGFSIGDDPHRYEGLAGYFRNYVRCHRRELNHGQLDSYSLDEIAVSAATNALQGTMIWDSPDFDSVESEGYRDAVLRTAALADIIILVISKDKYADLSVWELLSLLEPLGQKTFILLNKTDASSAETLTRSLHEKWKSIRADNPPPILSLPYLGGGQGLVDCDAQRVQLLQGLSQARRSSYRAEYTRHCKALVNTHWTQFIEPLLAEHRLEAQWHERLEEAQREAMGRYERDYLNHPNHYETFQRALAELLTLLELPGIGGALYAARRAVTWPVRQLTQLGKASLSKSISERSGEPAILHQLAEHSLIRMGEGILMSAASDPLERIWWTDLNRQLTQHKTSLLQAFDQSVLDYQAAFQPEIEKTAHSLYEHLQQHPMVLNTLRATRVSTDAMALAMALHTGGIGVQDFVIAPAMLSVTTLLAESAIGRYMNRAQEQLKLRQREAVEQLFTAHLTTPLSRITELLDPATRLNISAEVLAEAEHLRQTS